MSIINEVKQVTSDGVARKQALAKLNFPILIGKIKSRASFGLSAAVFSFSDLNEYDQLLLEKEGFKVISIGLTYREVSW